MSIAHSSASAKADGNNKQHHEWSPHRVLPVVIWIAPKRVVVLESSYPGARPPARPGSALDDRSRYEKEAMVRLTWERKSWFQRKRIQHVCKNTTPVCFLYFNIDGKTPVAIIIFWDVQFLIIAMNMNLEI